MLTRDKSVADACTVARTHHFELLDGMRAVAVLCVYWMHVGALSRANETAWYGAVTANLNLGVNLFFLISGFLLYRPHAVAILGGPPAPSLGTYSRRRILRIFPGYWTALTLLAIWPGLVGVFTKQWWVYYGMAQGYSSDWLWGGIAPAWSLTVEVGFYLTLPVFAAVLRVLCRGAGPARSTEIQLRALFLLGVIGELARNAFRLRIPALPTTLAGLLLDFSIGMALAVLSARAVEGTDARPWNRWIADHPGACWGVAVALHLVSSSALPHGFAKVNAFEFGLRHLAHVGVATLLILPAVFRERAGGAPRRLLRMPATRWLGKISFGVFLWHLPLLNLASAWGAGGWIPVTPFLSLGIAVLPVALLLGAASFYLVEQPLMRLR